MEAMTDVPNAGATTPAHEQPVTNRTYRNYVLFILVVVYTFNFLDRQIIGILAPYIQAEFNLTDGQLGLLGGIAFAFLYSTLGIPIAWLADRFNRVWIMTGALTVWSGMTALCGVAGNYVQLFLARVGVGVGEAGGVAPAYSLVADYFPPKERSKALAIYSLGVPIGSAIGIILGGVIANIIGWRAAFVVVGLAGVVLAPIFLFTVREPQRGRFDAKKPAQSVADADAAPKTAGILTVFGTIFPKPTFWFLAFGAACSSMMGYGMFFWVPSFIIRSYPTELVEFFAWAPTWLVPVDPSPKLLAGYFYGTIVAVGGTLGIVLGGVLGDRLGSMGKANYPRIPAIAFLFTAPLFALGVLSPSLTATFFIFLIPTALSLVWLGPVLTAVQHLAAPHMRATTSATFLLINNLFGIGGGIYALGAMSDLLEKQFAEDSLRYSMLCGAVLYLVAAVLLYLASRTMAKDWED